jgi:hypothetical protein
MQNELTFDKALSYVLKKIKVENTSMVIKGVFHNGDYLYIANIIPDPNVPNTFKLVESKPHKLSKEMPSLILVKDIALSYYSNEIIIITEELRDFYNREVINIITQYKNKYKDRINDSLELKILSLDISNAIELHLKIIIGITEVSYHYFFTCGGEQFV